ncbi:hypothetical protein BDP27DRAFT_1368554 [Rhodocollybia butyracea]|uniref:Uncharacterized protein n=1 Tax=Rhodocollybia butyracea TaxID=206335 RepID=A0A9P5PG56_9AGAR|nr:hypothetical protein BDP27DRAFT_1368554 [Rhodocollybia butyracea]
MNIGEEEEGIWKHIIVAKPACTPFKKSGWAIFYDVAELCPEKPKGSHTFRPITGVHGTPGASSQSISFTPPGSPIRSQSVEWDLDELNANMCHSSNSQPVDDQSPGSQNIDGSASQPADENITQLPLHLVHTPLTSVLPPALLLHLLFLIYQIVMCRLRLRAVEPPKPAVFEPSLAPAVVGLRRAQGPAQNSQSPGPGPEPELSA